MIFPEIDSFVVQLRSHYRARGMPDADEAADYYAAAVEGMYRASIGNPPGAEHFERVLALHRRADLAFEEKRVLLSEAFKNSTPVKY